MLNNSLQFTRGQVYYAHFGKSEYDIKPVLIIQNNKGNENADNLIVARLEKATKELMEKHKLVIEVSKTKLVVTDKFETISKEKIYRVAAIQGMSVPKPNAILNEEQLELLNDELLKAVGVTNDNFRKNSFIHRGELYFSNGFNKMIFDDSEERGDRLCLVLNEDRYNKDNVIVALLTTSPKKAERQNFPTHVKLRIEKDKISTVMLEHLRTIPKSMLDTTELYYNLSIAETIEVDECLKISLALC